MTLRYYYWLLIPIMTSAKHYDYVYYTHYDTISIHYYILSYYYTYDIELLLLAIMTIAEHYVH
jgi:hypothetical protein